MLDFIWLIVLTFGAAIVALAAWLRKSPPYLTAGLAGGAGALAITLLLTTGRALFGGPPVLGDQLLRLLGLGHGAA